MGLVPSILLYLQSKIKSQKCWSCQWFKIVCHIDGFIFFIWNNFIISSSCWSEWRWKYACGLILKLALVVIRCTWLWVIRILFQPVDYSQGICCNEGPKDHKLTHPLICTYAYTYSCTHTCVERENNISFHTDKSQWIKMCTAQWSGLIILGYSGLKLFLDKNVFQQTF